MVAAAERAGTSRVGLQRLEQVGRHETVFVVAPDAAPVPLLERVADARKVGATVFAIDAGDPDLEGLAHESLWVPQGSTERHRGSRVRRRVAPGERGRG